MGSRVDLTQINDMKHVAEMDNQDKSETTNQGYLNNTDSIESFWFIFL